ncbi:uncharacterized protein LOC116805303 isoform X2 [Drosophila grimshawi]|uniref:uncharacterized protein LOC116805303 isoform X2 n=1 Tax=Drosophila grimshawi TaxID=7222 RepID=UPI000C86FEEB|nr:uncharacterized protein LOC116805303 isoform X2 [Drosophila grimshawi]
MSPLIACLILLLIAMLQHQRVEAGAYHAIFKSDEHPNKCVVSSPEGVQLVIDSDQTVAYPGKCAEIYCGRASWALVYTSSSRMDSALSQCRFSG